MRVPANVFNVQNTLTRPNVNLFTSRSWNSEKSPTDIRMSVANNLPNSLLDISLTDHKMF